MDEQKTTSSVEPCARCRKVIAVEEPILVCRTGERPLPYHGECLSEIAWSEGYRSFESHLSFGANPYREKGPKDAWSEGFMSAEQDACTRDYDATIASVRETWH